jgi:SAM-dependent methyltransferase
MWSGLVHQDLMERLCCPRCRGRLCLQAERSDSGQVESGRISCPACGVDYPIVRGIPRFVATEDYVASFGRQWTRYAVEHWHEDETTFPAKTGFSLDELRGRVVLDAGCGGGRYSLVAARHGARVVAVDMSRAVDRAARLCAAFPHVDFVQADLLHLPLAEHTVDLAFSIGVMHHTSDTAAAFRQVASAVRPAGRLAVWLYRRNTAVQEALNETLRGIARRMTMPQLEFIATAGAVLGSVPVVNRLLNKLVNFSAHPVWENRVCDTFDWYSPRYQFHHTVAELMAWFHATGFTELRELSPEKSGHVYRWAYEHDLVVGSGVNVVGTKLGIPRPR